AFGIFANIANSFTGPGPRISAARRRVDQPARLAGPDRAGAAAERAGWTYRTVQATLGSHASVGQAAYSAQFIQKELIQLASCSQCATYRGLEGPSDASGNFGYRRGPGVGDISPVAAGHIPIHTRHSPAAPILVAAAHH